MCAQTSWEPRCLMTRQLASVSAFLTSRYFFGTAPEATRGRGHFLSLGSVPPGAGGTGSVVSRSQSAGRGGRTGGERSDPASAAAPPAAPPHRTAHTNRLLANAAAPTPSPGPAPPQGEAAGLLPARSRGKRAQRAVWVSLVRSLPPQRSEDGNSQTRRGRGPPRAQRGGLTARGTARAYQPRDVEMISSTGPPSVRYWKPSRPGAQNGSSWP